jgi:hypothetical protein
MVKSCRCASIFQFIFLWKSKLSPICPPRRHLFFTWYTIYVLFSSWVFVTLCSLMCFYDFLQSCLSKLLRRVWRYQRGNHNPYIEDEYATQWPKEYGQKDRQRSTKHTHKIKDRVTRTPLKTKLAQIDNADSGVKRKL